MQHSPNLTTFARTTLSSLSILLSRLMLYDSNFLFDFGIVDGMCYWYG